ncbi:MAG TPA: SRPBCC domain-containing protein [Candidatus Dormibacteraeota bacterium]|nr:SRPBCC domain-containing protein [Candidatus Dormibacteraeota bacterium]
MIPDKVEREIVIEAPVDVVWRIVTEPDQIVQWFAEEADLQLTPGAEGHFSFQNHRTWTLQVEAVDPPRRFAFRWRPANDERPPERNSMHVEFTLREEAGKTRLRVVESGFENVDWSREEMARYAEDHANGWTRYLGRLRDLVAS